MRLLYIPVVGPIKEVDVPDNALLNKAYELLDCSCIECVYILQHKYVMIIDESGKIKDPPKAVNHRASPFYCGFPYDLICGDVLIGKFGFTDQGADIVGLTENEVESFKEYFC